VIVPVGRFLPGSWIAPNRLAGLRGPYTTLKAREFGRSLRDTNANAEGDIAARGLFTSPNTL